MKIKILIIVIAAVLLVAIVFLKANQEKENKKEPPIDLTFDLSSYNWQLENCSYDKNVGPVATKDVAIAKAKEIWEEEFGHFCKVSDYYPVVVAYDSKNECWRLSGTLQNEDANVDATVPQTLISKDGTVLALWF